MACIPPNPRRVGYIVPIHGPLYMGSHIHQQFVLLNASTFEPAGYKKDMNSSV